MASASVAPTSTCRSACIAAADHSMCCRTGSSRVQTSNGGSDRSTERLRHSSLGHRTARCTATSSTSRSRHNTDSWRDSRDLSDRTAPASASESAGATHTSRSACTARVDRSRCHRTASSMGRTSSGHPDRSMDNRRHIILRRYTRLCTARSSNRRPAHNRDSWPNNRRWSGSRTGVLASGLAPCRPAHTSRPTDTVPRERSNRRLRTA